MKKVIIAHVSKQHSFHTAIALKREGVLYKYITTVYDRPSSLTSRAKKFLKGSSLKKASTRSCPELNDNDVVQFYEVLGLLRIFLGRFKIFNIDLFLMRIFAKKVARYAIKENVDAVIVYDGITQKYLDLIKKSAPHIITIMDVAIASRPFMKEVFENDMKKYNHENFLEEEKYLFKDRYLDFVMNDFRYTDYFFVASNVVFNSLKYCGIEDSRIVKVPYGVAIDQFDYVQKNVTSGALKLLFVGNLSYRKGIHHLLDVVSRYSKHDIQLSLAGGYDPEGEFYLKYSNLENVHFMGFVTRDVITATFQDSDIFVMPTMAEGMALVILEALATGTPVICTENSGGNDAIIDYENGIVCKAGDRDSFNDALKWMLQHRSRLPEMSLKAREVAVNYTWEVYYGRIGREIRTILEKVTE